MSIADDFEKRGFSPNIETIISQQIYFSGDVDRLLDYTREIEKVLKDCYRALIAQGCHLDKQMPLSERLDVAKKAQEVIAKAEGRTE